MKKKIFLIILFTSVFVYRNYAQDDDFEPTDEVEIGSSGLDLSPPEEVVTSPEPEAPTPEVTATPSESSPTEESVSESPPETTPTPENPTEETPQEIPHE